MENIFELSNIMKFLIIDENETYRTSITNSLRKLGFQEISSTYSSGIALNLLKKSKIDLIICDRNMPVIDGAQVLKEVRESFEIRGTPFLIMGDYNKVTREDIVLLAEYEIDGYLTKPFTAKSLMEKITASIEHYKNPKNLEYKIASAKQKLLEKEFETALDMFEKLLEAVPNSARLRVCIARCYKELKNFARATHLCNEAIQKNPLYAQSYDEMGRIHIEQNKIEEGLNCFLNAIALSPSYPVRYEQIIDALYLKEFYIEAELILKKSLENSVKFDNFNLKYGQVLFKMRKLDEAIIHLEKALHNNPSDKSLLNNIGICLKDLGRSEDALKHYNIALKRYPNDSKIMFNKALCLIAFNTF